MVEKTNSGNYFEDFNLGRVFKHATPRTITSGDVALYTALYGSRFSITSSNVFAKNIGYSLAPVDDMLTFHIVFGKTVPDISLNAIANLGYADGKFYGPVYPGDTLSAESEVIGLKENTNAKTGVVYIRSIGSNQNGETVLDYVRWVMVHKRNKNSPAPESLVPDLPDAVSYNRLDLPKGINFNKYDNNAAGSEYRWDNYEVGEKIDHIDGMTIEEAEHMIATRLYQNTAKVHFNHHMEKDGRFGQRLIYGGHIISIARALSFNGLANACRIIAINSGRHVAPVFAGDTIYAWSEVVEKLEFHGRKDIGALRIRTIATKDNSCKSFPGKDKKEEYNTSVVLDFNYTALMPR